MQSASEQMLPLVYVLYELVEDTAYNIHLGLNLFSCYKTISAMIESAHVFKPRANCLQCFIMFRDSNLPCKICYPGYNSFT